MLSNACDPIEQSLQCMCIVSLHRIEEPAHDVKLAVFRRTRKEIRENLDTECLHTSKSGTLAEWAKAVVDADGVGDDDLSTRCRRARH